MSLKWKKGRRHRHLEQTRWFRLRCSKRRLKAKVSALSSFEGTTNVAKKREVRRRAWRSLGENSDRTISSNSTGRLVIVGGFRRSVVGF